MKDFSEYCARLKKDLESSIEAVANSSLPIEDKKPIYNSLIEICEKISLFKINLKDPESIYGYKRKVLDEFVGPKIKEAKDLAEKILILESPISTLEN